MLVTSDKKYILIVFYYFFLLFYRTLKPFNRVNVPRKFYTCENLDLYTPSVKRAFLTPRYVFSLLVIE